MREAILAITYIDRFGNRHSDEGQGKFYYQNLASITRRESFKTGKPIYLADMTASKFMYDKKLHGYTISKQIMEAFEKVKINPQIIYRRRDLGQLYFTKLLTFRQKGVFGNWDNHQQYCLSLTHNNWKAKPILNLNEPKNLPVMTVDDWIKTASVTSQVPAQKPIVEDFTIPLGVKMRLGEEFRRKYA